MCKYIFLFLLGACLFTAKAQLINPSFEQTDSLGNIAGWTLAQGKLNRFSVVSFGVIPFTASNGNYFILLESDTTTLPVKRALFEQRFSFNDTPGSISLNYLYIPENTSQRADITTLFTRWNGTQRDTILYKNDTIPVVANGNAIPIQWNVYAGNLKGSYRSALLPDSGWIRLSNTDNTVPGKNIRLFADNITFGKWMVGLAEQTAAPQVSVFPNPASEHLVVAVNAEQQPDHFLLTAISGKQFVISGYGVTAGHQYSIPVREIPDGLYSLAVMKNSTQLYRHMIFIKH